MERRVISISQVELTIFADSPLLLRDPEDRWVSADDEAAVREKMMDKTLADSYPASDPPSTLPNPSVDSICSAAREFAPTRAA